MAPCDMKARIAELEAKLKWQPMETAPRDGSRLLLWSDSHDRSMHGRWLTGCPGWFDDHGKIIMRVSCWMFSPEPPEFGQ